MTSSNILESCLYEGSVWHHRMEPQVYRFSHRLFMFYLDLDELDNLASRLRWLSRNHFNVYEFRDRDHLMLSGQTVKENVLEWVRMKAPGLPVKKIKILTQLRTWGYIFNPVSFYFCFDDAGRPLGVLPEVSNTFREMKPYWLGTDRLVGEAFKDRQIKHFYISPFMEADLELDFNLRIPDERLDLRVDDYRAGKKIFLSALSGRRRELHDGALLRSMILFPFITLQIITMIHWHALRLYLKKIPFYRIEDHPELQQGLYREYKRKRAH